MRHGAQAIAIASLSGGVQPFTPIGRLVMPIKALQRTTPRSAGASRAAETPPSIASSAYCKRPIAALICASCQPVAQPLPAGTRGVGGIAQTVEPPANTWKLGGCSDGGIEIALRR